MWHTSTCRRDAYEEPCAHGTAWNGAGPGRAAPLRLPGDTGRPVGIDWTGHVAVQVDAQAAGGAEGAASMGVGPAPTWVSGSAVVRAEASRGAATPGVPLAIAQCRRVEPVCDTGMGGVVGFSTPWRLSSAAPLQSC